MRQLLQDLRSGELLILDVPTPAPGAGHLLLQTSRTLISAGTERTLTAFAKAGYLEKARMQPERVRQVFDKLRTDGLWSTVEAIRTRLDQPMSLGYCSVGQVVAVGESVSGFRAGDRVVSNSPHAEMALAPRNLCARVPDEVSDDEAAFTVVAAIGLQAVRLVSPTLGETVVVAGLGLIGQLTVQILRANGCRVLGFDPHPARVAQAAAFGAEAFGAGAGQDVVEAVMQATAGVGADAVIITASTSSDELISQCAAMSRKRGRIVLTGVIGLDLKRADFYEKELTFQVSCSYGPGRYDETYEEQGRDYPLPYVRWTEQRNFEAVLRLMQERKLVTGPLVTDRFVFEQSREAFARLDSPEAIGILLEYAQAVPKPDAMITTPAARPATGARPSGSGIAVLGAGSFAQGVILPALSDARADLRVVASAEGTSAAVAARRFGVAVATTDAQAAIVDDSVGGVVIATRHDLHASMVIRALEAGKHVLVEKPLCLTEAELDQIVAARDRAATHDGGVPALAVGFNRRYAPLALRMREAVARRAGPAFVTFHCNAGYLPPEHWAHDPRVGGGRIIGEACHFIDFAQFLVGARIIDVTATGLIYAGEHPQDSAAITLAFADGSVAQVNYHSCGHRSYPKERCEVAFDGKQLVLDNFRRLSGYGLSVSAFAWRQDKGHRAQFAAFVGLVGGRSLPENFPVSFDVTENVMRMTLRAARAISTR